jgi:hypothetical protein
VELGEWPLELRVLNRRHGRGRFERQALERSREGEVAEALGLLGAAEIVRASDGLALAAAGKRSGLSRTRRSRSETAMACVRPTGVARRSPV